MIALYLLTLYLLTVSIGETYKQAACRARDLEHESIICVCDKYHCDYLEDVKAPEEGYFVSVSSSKDGLRFHVQGGEERGTSYSKADGFTTLKIDYSSPRQEIYGFGGSFTDAAGINIKSLDSKAQKLLLKSYFTAGGLSYNMGRFPIGGSDFSTHPYSYDDHENDIKLEHFSLAQEDFDYKIPIILEAKSMMYPAELLLVASPWSPPAWMKDNNQFNGTGSLKKENYDLYAKYIAIFLRSYEKNKVTVWGITTQNEPVAGLKGGPYENWLFNSCGWTNEDMLEWIKSSLVPRFQKEKIMTLVIIHDGGLSRIEEATNTILGNAEANGYIDGIGIHWYDKFDHGVLTKVHHKYPDKFLLHTEACNGYDVDEKVVLGSWKRAEKYAEDIIKNLNNYVIGWIDWNLALDVEGGPNWVSNFVDSPIIVNKETGEFYKQPMYYALGHFSKFIPRGSVSLPSSVERNDIMAAAFRTPKKDIVLVVLNRSDEEKKLSLETPRKTYVNLFIKKRTILTLLFKGGDQIHKKNKKDEF